MRGHKRQHGTPRHAAPSHATHAAPHRGLTRAVAVLAGLAVAAAVLLITAPAQAASQRVAAQLALSGVATKDNPTGGSQIGIHPGDSVSFTSASVPTAGLAKLGLGGLVGTVNSLLDGAVRFQVKADFRHLPGGHKATILRGKKAAHFTFRHAGTYPFTWTVQKVSVLSSLLGTTTKITNINLNGNELRKAGIKLNAANQYVGEVVVRKHPPSGGISIELPSVHVAPSAPVVGNLPTVGVPGVRLPTVHVSVPNLGSGLPGVGGGSGGGGSGGGSGGGGSGNSNGNPLNFTGPGLTVPQEVVPQGDNAQVIAGSDPLGALPAFGGGSGARPVVAGAVAGSRPSAAAPAQPRSRAVADKHRVIGMSDRTQSPSGQLPVLLAIIAIIALALVAGTYARLFLVRRHS